MKVYLLGGLGADTRVFHRLTWSSEITPITVTYINPLAKEPLQDYAKRLLQTIKTDEPFAIIGLSFGGWVAKAMLQYVQPQFVILISSNASYKEMPMHYKLVSKLHLHKLVPVKLGKKINFLSKFLMGVSDTENIKLLQQVFASSDSKFTKWAIDVIMKNKLTDEHHNIIRIHGNKDYVLPIKNQKPNFIIKNGGHLIVLENADEVSAILNDILCKQ